MKNFHIKNPPILKHIKNFVDLTSLGRKAQRREEREKP